ncbi:MAG: TauD/TfdA family dioxygenase [Alphaproteobacteria bacterium]|nr:TauD/TfdA family dioxygenase [Alphaproteobacteria bacterium]
MTDLHDGLKIRPLDAGYGARIFGLDHLPDDSQRAAIQAALDEYGVVAIDGQQLDRATLVAFTRQFGESVRHQVAEYLAGDNPEVMILSNNFNADGKRLGAPNNGIFWHSDQIHQATPVTYTLLYGHEVPRDSGDTLFADMRAVHDALPNHIRERLAGRNVVHSFRASYEKNYIEAEPLTEARRAANPDVAHPALRTHPTTGRKSVYIDPDSAIAIDGLAKDESDAILAFVFDFLERPEFVYRHRWKRGDLVVWDNRCLMHRATGYDDTVERRIMWRTQTKGAAPF